MNKIERIVCYDEGDDSLTFIKDNSGVKTINTGITLITLNDNGIVTALELMGAQKNFGIPKNVLESMNGARVNFNFNNEKKKLFINILIHYQNKRDAPVVISEDVTKFKELFIEPQELTASLCV